MPLARSVARVASQRSIAVPPARPYASRRLSQRQPIAWPLLCHAWHVSTQPAAATKRRCWSDALRRVRCVFFDAAQFNKAKCGHDGAWPSRSPATCTHRAQTARPQTLTRPSFSEPIAHRAWPHCARAQSQCWPPGLERASSIARPSSGRKRLSVPLPSRARLGRRLELHNRPRSVAASDCSTTRRFVVLAGSAEKGFRQARRIANSKNPGNRYRKTERVIS